MFNDTMANSVIEDENEGFKPSQQVLPSSILLSSQQVAHTTPSTTSTTGILDQKKGSLPSRKSVDFAILPPSKRSRTSLPWTAKQVVDALSTSIAAEERFEAVQKACDSFRHDVQTLHDEEVGAGADAALTKHLAFLVYLQRHMLERQLPQDKHDSIATEIALSCEALESLLRASSQIVGTSFKRMGPELMQMMISIINNDISRRQQVVAARAVDKSLAMSSSTEAPRLSAEDCSSRDDSQRGFTSIYTSTTEYDTLLKKATKILGHFARVGEATKPIAYFPGLMNCLVDLISLRPYECFPWEARLSCLWIIANLACNAENMKMIAESPGLVGALVEVACRPLQSTDAIETTIEILRSRSISSRAVMNLSWLSETKTCLAENPALIDLLAELIVYRSDNLNKSRTMQGILTATRRHAVGALRNLAAAPRVVKIRLCGYKGGHLLDVLTDAALNDPDKVVKDRAFATIHNLSIHDTAQAIAGRPALVMALKDVLVAEEVETKSPNDDGTPKQHASATLLVLERTITPTMDSYDNLKGLLQAVKQSNESNRNGDIAAV